MSARTQGAERLSGRALRREGTLSAQNGCRGATPEEAEQCTVVVRVTAEGAHTAWIPLVWVCEERVQSFRLSTWKLERTEIGAGRGVSIVAGSWGEACLMMDCWDYGYKEPGRWFSQ